jgi:hypothetical protein
MSCSIVGKVLHMSHSLLRRGIKLLNSGESALGLFYFVGVHGDIKRDRVTKGHP